MLEAKNLYKEYKTKNGPVVKALDDVSIKFEETGMVFILGKSGSGKSTLLNVLGGLDKYDSGEVIVKGKSSKDFSQADFDSYRNTFVGFIFQDYNILEEFTISKNIGLALELQGKKADKNAINELMEQVDLKGYGNRKPNTLSGGQRQRVAIARALVKNPEIIMADEPTGALDSATGKQVFDTLKKLSKTKLVLIVSHDREFAEYYGDRIIELADGKIISDVKKYKSAPKESEGLEIVDDKILTIKKGTKLDAKKTKTLNDFILSSDQDVIVSIDEKANKEFKKFAMIDDEGNKESFKLTEGLNIKDYNPDDFKLIRSKLPGKDSFKMGASGLKSKPIRLFFTIILSAIAFAMFGLADTMGSYDKVENTIRSVRDSNIDYATFAKRIAKSSSGSDYVYYENSMLSQSDFDKLNSELNGYSFIPVFNLHDDNYSYSFSNNLYSTDGISYDGLYRSNLYGFVEADENVINQFGTLIGNSRLPSNDEEIVITKYTYDIFAKANYKDSNGNTKIEISDIDNLIGKKIRLHEYDFIIVGVLDTNFDMSRYKKMDEAGFGESISDYMLKEEFGELLSNSAHALGYLNKGWISNNKVTSEFSSLKNTIYFQVKDESPSNDSFNAGFKYLSNYTSNMNDEIIWLETAKTTLADDEVILASDVLDTLEFDISGSKYQYHELVSDDCLDNVIINGIRQLLLSDPTTSEYNPYDVKRWYLSDWNEYASEAEFITLTNEQKANIENYIENASAPYCVNLLEFFETNEIKTKLESEYNTRVEQGTSIWENYDSYVYDLEYFLRYGYYNHGEVSPTSVELSVLAQGKEYIINKLKEYAPSYVWLQYYGANNEDYYSNPRKFKVVGYYIGNYTSSSDRYNKGIISNVLYKEFEDSLGGIYNFAISKMDYTNEELVRKAVEYTYSDFGDIKYDLKNPVMTSMNEINDMIETLSQVFLYIGIGFAVFASLLLLNFITISISYKRREIGVLRAIGARGRDVFKIFFNEAFIIAFINFVLATIGCFVVCMILNNTIRNDYGMLITILNMGLRQVLLMFAVSLLVAFISSFLPVYKIARKKPIDAIRNS